MAEYEPFDHEDPRDIVADMFRRQVTQLVIDAGKVTLYRDLNPQQQIECFVGGALTGLVGVAFASVTSEGYDTMVKYIIDCLPFARLQAENVRGPGGETLVNHHDRRPIVSEVRTPDPV